MENKKFYQTRWFMVLMFIVFFPIGFYLLWKDKTIKPKTKKIILGCFIGLIVIGILLPEPPTAESSYDISTAEITYTTEDIPGQEAVYADTETYTTELSGEYVIGTAPKDLVTGDEKAFSTSQSGSYTAGTDFPAGVYDIVATQGNGNVQGSGLNEIMGVGTGYSGIDDMYVSTYDNHTFAEGDTLEVSGVAVDLVPQSDDSMTILPGTYNLVAKEGNGNVQGTGLNEIMGVGTGVSGLDDMYVEQYDNKEFKSGDTLKVTGVSIALEPKEDKVMVKEATDPIPGHEQTESLTSSPQGDVCKVDNKETDCSKVAKYDELKTNLAVEDTVTETVTYENDEYVCSIDDLTKDCSKLVDYDNLVKELESQL